MTNRTRGRSVLVFLKMELEIGGVNREGVGVARADAVQAAPECLHE